MALCGYSPVARGDCGTGAGQGLAPVGAYNDTRADMRTMRQLHIHMLIGDGERGDLVVDEMQSVVGARAFMQCLQERRVLHVVSERREPKLLCAEQNLRPTQDAAGVIDQAQTDKGGSCRLEMMPDAEMVKKGDAA